MSTDTMSGSGAHGVARSRQVRLPFSEVHDMIMVDKARADLFRSVGQTRGLFSGLSTWPFLDDLLEEKSRTVFESSGRDAWAAAGGVRGPGGQLTCDLASELTTEVVREVVGTSAGMLWRDDNKVLRAVRFIPRTGASGDALLGLSLACHEGGAEAAPVRGRGPTGALSRAPIEAGRRALADRAGGLRLIRRAEQLYWTIFAAVHRQQRSTVLLPDVLLRDAIWGAKVWPDDWRQEVYCTLLSLMDLRAEVLRIKAQGWRPTFGSSSAIVDHVEKLWVTDPEADQRCGVQCLCWKRGVRHRHFRVGIGQGFLGVLERFCTRTEGHVRVYDFFRPLPDADAAGGGESVCSPAERVVVNIPAAVFGPSKWSGLTDGEIGVFQGIINELTRRRSSSKLGSRPDGALVLSGNRVTNLAAKESIPCPYLAPDGKYVVFGGNGTRAGAGYRIVGDQGRGWLFKCGYGLAPGATGTEVCRAVRAFLQALGRVAERFGLTAVALRRDGKGHLWYKYEQILALSRGRAGVEHLLGVHLRVYGPLDYPSRIRAYFAEAGGFAPDAVDGGKVGELRRDDPDGIGARLLLAGLSQKEVAKRLGVSPPFVSQIVHGRRSLPEGRRCVLEQMLGERIRSSDSVIESEG